MMASLKRQAASTRDSTFLRISPNWLIFTLLFKFFKYHVLFLLLFSPLLGWADCTPPPHPSDLYDQLGQHADTVKVK